MVKNDINPNVLAYEPSPGKMTELFQIGPGRDRRVGHRPRAAFANTGFPVDFVYPKEGAVDAARLRLPVAKPNASPLASEFIKTLLEPKLQLVHAEGLWLRPGLEVGRCRRRSSARWLRSASARPSWYTPDWDTITSLLVAWRALI